jgi:hypothetical protein
MRLYSYVGPDELKSRLARGKAIRAADDLSRFPDAGFMTFIVDATGTLYVADRHIEHVSCAGGEDVLSAGELKAVAEATSVRVVFISNQSSGYCPEPESWPAVAKALDESGIAHPGRFTFAAIFRRCRSCKQRNLVKEDWFECGVCGSELPRLWNCDE